MRSNPYCAIAIFTVLTLCGMASSFAQSPESRARTLDLRACELLLNNGQESGIIESRYRASYDTLTKFIETCADDPNSWSAFGTMSVDVDALSSDKNRYVTFREWLKKVLYLNLSQRYYCSDVNVMLNTFTFFDSTRGYDINGRCAVLKYLLQSGKCPEDASSDSEAYAYDRQSQHRHWLDTTAHAGKDTNIYKLDTTLPSLEQLGLTILYGPNGSVTPSVEAPNLLSGVRISDNPFAQTTDVVYELSKDAAVEIEVFDVLGRAITGDDRVKLQTPGVHRVPLDLHSSPSGDYYVRLSVNGRSTTLKMQKK